MGKFYPCVTLFFGTVLFSASTYAEPETSTSSFSILEQSEFPNSMGALGDSISAAALASYSRLDAKSWSTQVQVLRDLWNWFYHWDVEFIEKRHLSWSTGFDPNNRVESHAFRLKLLNPKLRVFSAAITGADVESALNVQLPNMKTWAESELGQGLPDYITLMIGANDVCARSVGSMTRVDDFEGQVKKLYAQIFKANPHVKLLSVNIPRMEDLQAVASRSSLRFGFFNTCSDVWEAIPVCKNVLKLSNKAQREVMLRNLREYRSVLRRVAQAYSMRYPGQVSFVSKVGEVTVNPAQLAIDCFHPSLVGQKNLADATFEKTWWSQSWAHIQKRARLKYPTKMVDTTIDEPNMGQFGEQTPTYLN